jgi:hypothetical protein
MVQSSHHDDHEKARARCRADFFVVGGGILNGHPTVAGPKGRLPCRVLGLDNPDCQLLDTSVNV